MRRVLISTMHQQWAGGATAATAHHVPPFGSGIAIMRIPRFGKGYKFAVVQGISTAACNGGRPEVQAGSGGVHNDALRHVKLRGTRLHGGNGPDHD